MSTNASKSNTSAASASQSVLRLVKVMRYVEIVGGLLALIVLGLKLYFSVPQLSAVLVLLLTTLAYYYVGFGLWQVRQGYREWEEEEKSEESDFHSDTQASEHSSVAVSPAESQAGPGGAILDVVEFLFSRAAIATVILGILFRVMKWRIATTLLQIGLISLGVALLLVLLRARPDRRKYTRRMLIRFAIYGVVGLLVLYGLPEASAMGQAVETGWVVREWVGWV